LGKIRENVKKTMMEGKSWKNLKKTMGKSRETLRQNWIFDKI
jgi:hypothetical protein